ncbi:CdaR family transcriptional regulator [Halobacillus mangrovi]|uniref:Transcriptional regulator n=1 Tax=Halobacillus mangrovi TaxID=402384 RepID=A0A1W5ZZJ6_9BACI|nr:sugar diacid recognition domain-containing protein [Halobacillus mangrovi]ARI78680.1 hypothetical protein HM131_18350 [Halobacillus mangrovi]
MLTKEIAEDIVKETSLRLNRNVNIMNNKGIIIAAKDHSRIGQIHEGALKVLKIGETLIIHSNQKGDWKGAHPGINLPIIFQENILGVIGITGDPNDMGDLGGLVKMTTELMIKQEYITSQMEWKQRTKDMIIEELLKDIPSQEQINRGLHLLGTHFSPPYITVVIQLQDRSISNQTLIHKIEENVGCDKALVGFINSTRLYIIFTCMSEDQAENKLHRVYYQLKRLRITFRMSHSTLFYDDKKLSRSFEDCELALKITKDGQDLISFTQVETKALIYQINDEGAKHFLSRIEEYLDKSTIQTLKTFFENDLNIQQSAEALFVHRNTLIYRLQKIKKKTGYDPKTFRDALTLQIAMWLLSRAEINGHK